MSWESKPMETLASRGELIAYKHRGFWHPMDTLRDKTILKNSGTVGKLHGKYGK